MDIREKIEKDAPNFKTAKDQAIEYLRLAKATLSGEKDATDNITVVDKISKLTRDMKQQNRKMELVNYEGPVLTVIRVGPNSFTLIDQWKKEIRKLTRKDLLKYFIGDLILEDSRGSFYSHPMVHHDARPSAREIDEFMYAR